MDTLERIKVLINSSTPIILMETVEEERALALVRQAAADLSLPVFEWSIADGLTRSPGSSPSAATLAPSKNAAAERGRRRNDMPLLS